MYGDMLHRGGDAAGALAQYEEARSFYVQVRNGNAYLFCVVKCNILIETLTIYQDRLRTNAMEIQTRPAFVLRTYCIAQYLYLQPIHNA